MQVAPPIILFIIALVYFYAVAPNRRRRVRPITRQKYFAHRGLHDASAPENSLAAFQRAVLHGYGIELDVQLTADEQIVVFHDIQLTRMCGADGSIPDMTLEQLRAHRLLGTGERIPTLDEALSVVGGRVPLLIEIKLSPRLDRLSRLVAKRMERYRGEYLIESFAPQCLKTLRRAAPNVPRGQLVGRFDIRNRSLPVAVAFALSNLLLNFLSRPDFIAYEQSMDTSMILRVMRKVYRAPLAAWTIRSREELDALEGRSNMVIFEGFEPE